MVRQILIIGNVIEASDGNIVLAVDFSDLSTRQEYSQKSFEEIKTEFNSKSIEIVGTDLRISTKIMAVDVSSSLANFRNIFLKIPKFSKTSKIKIKDEVNINL